MGAYHFIIRAVDCTYDDPDGEPFASEGAAMVHGYRIVRELKQDGFDPSAVLYVTNEQGATIHSVPFWVPA